MKKLQFFTLRSFVLLFLVSGICYSCQQARPQRKKLPSFNNLDEIEAGWQPFNTNANKPTSPEMAFATTDVDMLFNGVPTSCVSIALTDPSMDSSAMNLLNTYKPFALPLIAEWAKQNKAVALDFRTIGGTEERAEYTIERPGSFSIPVIFLWDKLSARRAAFFMQQLNDAPAGFVCKKVNNQQL